MGWTSYLEDITERSTINSNKGKERKRLFRCKTSGKSITRYGSKKRKGSKKNNSNVRQYHKKYRMQPNGHLKLVKVVRVR